MENKRVALLVHSCDRYELLYKGFEFFFARSWSFDIPCNYYFATEEKATRINGFNNILSGKGEWSDRLIKLLNMLPEDYVLYFQEDMWLTKPVNPDFLREVFESAIKNKWKQVKLHSSEVYKTDDTGYNIRGFQVAKLQNQQSDFLMSHQVTLWDKNFLLHQLVKGEHPWRNERKGTKRLRKSNPVIYQIDYFAENGKDQINHNHKTVKRSEYMTVSINGTFGPNIIDFVKELKMAESPYPDYADKIEHNFRFQITHDGKPRPRKEGFHKVIIKWVKERF
jgi:hypothetical protein